MARVTLIHPGFDCRFNGMPLGLLYVGTALEKEGNKVTIIDLNADPMLDVDFRSKIQEENPDYVGISSTSPTHLDACDIAKQVKNVLDVPVIKGGRHETSCYETTLENHDEIDFSVVGPGEETTCELITALEDGKDPSKVKGVAYRDGGKVVFTGERSLPRDIDAIAHPDRTLVKHATSYDFDIFGGLKTTQIRMSRGCSYGCNFCANDKNVNVHSPDYVLEEISEIARQRYEAIFWDDAIFTRDRELTAEILHRMIAEGFDFQMGAQTRADVNITPEMMELMRDAGFSYISFGMESGDPEMLQYYNKRLDVDDVRDAVKMSHDAGLATSLTMIIGAPGEDLDSVRRSIDALNRIRPGSVSWSTYSLYPNSSLDFDPSWYEDPELSADQAWKQFDEGYKAKHVKDIDYVIKTMEFVRQNLDPSINI